MPSASFEETRKNNTNKYILIPIQLQEKIVEWFYPITLTIILCNCTWDQHLFAWVVFSYLLWRHNLNKVFWYFQISNMKAILIFLSVMLVNAGKSKKPPKVPSDPRDRVCYYCILANGPQCLFPCQPYGKPYVNSKSCFKCLAVDAPECLHPCGNLSISVLRLISSI